MSSPATHRSGFWWLPSAAVAAVGVLAVVIGIKTGGPEVVDGAVIGVLAFLVASVMLFRRASE